MRLIVGLGNPGPEYRDTRHNIGFMAVEAMAARFGVSKQQSKYNAMIGHCLIGGEKALLLKPLTYMNLSGRSVQPVMHFYKLQPGQLMVVYDDMDLPLGRLRVRKSGGAGGHKGMISIINALGTQDFPRMRVGIGRPEYHDNVNWVLSQLGPEDKACIQSTVNSTVEAVEKWIKLGIDAVMNEYNR